MQNKLSSHTATDEGNTFSTHTSTRRSDYVQRGGDCDVTTSGIELWRFDLGKQKEGAEQSIQGGVEI